MPADRESRFALMRARSVILCLGANLVCDRLLFTINRKGLEPRNFLINVGLSETILARPGARGRWRKAVFSGSCRIGCGREFGRQTPKGAFRLGVVNVTMLRLRQLKENYLGELVTPSAERPAYRGGIAVHGTRAHEAPSLSRRHGPRPYPSPRRGGRHASTDRHR